MPRYEIQDPRTGRTVEIEGASMPSAQQLQSIFARVGGGDRKPARPEDFMDPPADEGSPVGRFASNAWDMVNPVTIVKGVAGAVRHPIDTVGALAGAQVGQFGKARDAFREGRYSEAVGHTGAGLLPVLGPVAADIGEQVGTGDVAGGLGRAAGLIAPIGGVRTAANAVKRVIPTKALTRTQKAAANATQTDAVRWALDQGIPVDAATASGNRVARAAKWAADSSTGGALPGQRSAAARAEALSRTGRGLAADAHPTAATAETAGAAVREGVEGVITREAGAANAAYGKVRAAADPMVDLTASKAALKPIYDRLLRKKELTGQLQGAEGRAAVALDALVGGADTAPLSVVDRALGDIKAMARGADMPELRDAGQGLAAKAVSHLEGAVQTAAKDAGVWDDLRAGRDATIAKWTAAETLDKLRAEPVQTFRMLTQAGDSAIDRLRDVKKIAPAEVPKIGRAVLDDMLDTATAEGGFGREAKLWADWQRMGAETKAMLYPDPALRASLDKFFLVGKKMAENPNPSGSALVGGLTTQGFLTLLDPVTSASTVIGGYALSKILNSPKTARLLVDGMQMPRTASAARSVAARLRHVVSTAQATQASTRQPSR